MGLGNDLNLSYEPSRDATTNQGSATSSEAAATADTQTIRSVAMDSATDGVGSSNWGNDIHTHAFTDRLGRGVGHGAVLHTAGGAASAKTKNTSG